MNDSRTDKINFRADINKCAVDALERITEVRDWLFKLLDEHEKGSEKWQEIDEQCTNLMVAWGQVGGINFTTSATPRISHEEANARHERFVQALHSQGYCDDDEIRYYCVAEEVILPDGKRLLISEVGGPYRTREEAARDLVRLETHHPRAHVGYAEFCNR